MAENHDFNSKDISKEEYDHLLKGSIEDMREAMEKLQLLKKLSDRRRISDNNVKAIRNCAYYVLTNVDFYLMDIQI